MKISIFLPKTLKISVFCLLCTAFLPIFAAAQNLTLALTYTDTRLNDDEIAVTLDAEVTTATAFSGAVLVFSCPTADIKPNTTPVVTYEGEADFGAMQQNVTQNALNGEITVTLTRNNDNNTAAMGKLVRLTFVVIDNVMGKIIDHKAQKRDWAQHFLIKKQNTINKPACAAPRIIVHNGSIHIISDNTDLRTIFIYDVAGRLWLTQTLSDTNSIDIAALSSGIYMLQIVSVGSAVCARVFSLQ